MKNILASICCLLILTGYTSFGQQTSETDFSIGISKTRESENIEYWQEATPTYLFLNASKSWYNDEQKLSLRKDAGVKGQYANIAHTSGGLGAFNEKTGTVISLFANASLQARYSINNALAIGLGPEAELLLLGYNNIDDDYSSIYIPPRPTTSHTSERGINRNYFKKPSYGIKISLFQGSLDAKTTLGLHFSYLWTKSDPSGFYASNFTRLSLSIGFKKPKNEPIIDPVN